MLYRVGWPFWKQIALTGNTVMFRVRIHRDEEAGTYWAKSQDLDGLIVEADNLDDLDREIRSGAVALFEAALETDHAPRYIADMRYCAA